MSQRPEHHRRDDIGQAVQRDLARRARREKGHRTFWKSMGMLGMVGWPIALATVGGALAGRVLDQRFGTGLRFTLILLTAGVAIGSYAAWRGLKGRIDGLD